MSQETPSENLSGSENEIKLLLEKNLELTQEIHEMTHAIKRYITFQKIMSFIYFLLIVVPLVLGAIFLPPILKNMLQQYESLLGQPGVSDIFKLQGGSQPIDPAQLEQLLNGFGK